ncbi:Short-chain dehydrogenase/reductase SDR OS=Tsukamurella paurometabola (strain ATCC 8368 / DSM/ CCUG 35730 / CIP 100753 / JCM 10117 / KCTC 9821 / NBRC 16120/ NCIMB 702349 / NCTC 13040) OX=521096 GN=Tpau_3139 PE=3 SV=1 [Tsukamurella paurometabola]|uniref:Short-chain dehydrogenase/reductase SDR n=1 Tax=Tsukamurella paurometabola (strain ATCC 8368 / DSM 20162 / CCUG 35730 / CIP 100753 / JCM 10117 / KCTC 9821 / NBRC 16120 / NCIMB 702349 / NCTC 13040) TaxID=521096 RepID=D5UV08_TSUPD|nr:SDR family NAD(P)-dependent oxidoreductase [Tsukamurella paurometabola]ADG79726.1 short-chain dehydrogenase/reductase SDR [Tsukamurella paurometabola DSM 20162]SUP36950.1 Serine 3-dehydrogenase [Tsukamurella paurometabola]
MSEVAVVTGASSGIGAATARHLVRAGFDVVIGARRLERLEDLKAQLEAEFPERIVTALPLDVTDVESVTAFTDAIPAVDVLVNNAGGAIGTETIDAAHEADWLRMYDINVLSILRVTQRLLPKLRQSPSASVVTIGSIAAHEAYATGAGYNAAKFGARAVTRALRLELKGEPIRVIEIDPGLVETEFSIVRLRGDVDGAAKVYEGVDNLHADDIADAVTWAVTRPPHVNIDNITILARDQVSARDVHRRNV